jgi:hypothetical protein
LLELQGVALDLVHATNYHHQFLHEQIEYREKIAEAEQSQDYAALEQIHEQLETTAKQMELELHSAFANGAVDEVLAHTKHLAFYAKLIKLVNEALSAL